MTRVNRRAVLAGAASAAAVPAVGQPTFTPMDADKVVFISDVHIGDNTPTVWYQRSFHEPFLAALLDYVAANAGRVRELVILGDFVDFWTYPPDVRPPTFARIVAANPEILGPGGKLARTVAALDGRVSYVPGNHDMSVTQADLNTLNPGGHRIRLRGGEVYFPLGEDRRLACAHGHRWTLFNAPDPATPLAPLPLGHFVTRSFCHMLQQRLPAGQSVADLVDQGAPNGVDFAHLARALDNSFVDTALNYAKQVTGIPEDLPIRLASGETTSLAQVRGYYRTLWARCAAAAGGAVSGEMETAKSALADANGTYLSWFAQRLGVAEGADLVVFGHTHTPIRGLKNGFVDYVNTGFDCPSRPDIGAKHPTFIEVDVAAMKPQLRQVAWRDGRYAIEDHQGAKLDTITYGPTFDYSTYVTIDNREGTSDLIRTAYTAPHGRYVVAPPARVARGQVGRFWLQDYPGPEGSAGAVSYSAGDGRAFDLAFGCPTGIAPNRASGATFRSKAGDGDYGRVNQAPRLGHPFFVEFSV